MNYIFSNYLPTHHVDHLVIAARWEQSDLDALRQTLQWANRSGFTTLVIGPIMQYDTALPRLLAMSIKLNDPELPTSHRLTSYRDLDEEMSQLAQTVRGVRYISYFKMLCRQDFCLEYAGDGVPLQSDYGHLTAVGSVLVANKLRESGVLDHATIAKVVRSQPAPPESDIPGELLKPSKD
jgi:hypothetical protein